VSLLELDGLALALAVSTLAVLATLLAELGALGGAARGLGFAALVVCALALVAFVPPTLVLGALAAAALGLVVYVALVALIRPRPLVTSWRYLRGLR
jgi:hypothetical protein